MAGWDSSMAALRMEQPKKQLLRGNPELWTVVGKKRATMLAPTY